MQTWRKARRAARLWRLAWSAAAAAILASAQAAPAYVHAPFTLGKIIEQSKNITVLRVEKVDPQKNLIFYRKVRDLKGTRAEAEVKHNIGRRGFHPREWRTVMAWAKPGEIAVCFSTGSASETCIDGYWYQAHGSGWATMTHAEPFFLRSFAGKPEKLAEAVTAMVAGREVIVPCMVDGDEQLLHLRKARLQRVRASLKLLDYNPRRDFVGWGAEEFQAITNMPGFTHYAAVTRVDPEALGVAVCDYDGDGKVDLCLYGAARVALLRNAGKSLNEVPLNLQCGARGAVWLDVNADQRPDLFLATPLGPRLFLNQPKGLHDASVALPAQGYYHLRAAARLDYDGDGRADLLVADGFRGLRLWRNLGAKIAPTAAKLPTLFEDVSAQVGLGLGGVAGTLKGDHLAAADVNGDKRTDFLYSAGSGVLVLNTARGFVAAGDCGITYRPGGVAPAFGDFNGDGAPDLFVPQADRSKLLQNDGRGRFTDVTAQAGALARGVGRATCACWADFNRRGRLDLFVGCLRAQNRYLRNVGQGKFADGGEEIGLYQRIFNTRAMCVADVNADGTPDLVLNNEGQESAVLVGDPARMPEETASR